MCASFMVVAILFLAPCSCESFIDEPALQQGDVQAANLDIEETEMKGEEDGYEDNGEVHGTFPDELVPLRLADRQAEPSSRDKERRDWVYSEDFSDDGYEEYNGEFLKDSESVVSDVAEGEPAEGEDFAEEKFNGDVGTYEEIDDWNVAGNSETVVGDVRKDLADAEGKSRTTGEDAIKTNDQRKKARSCKPQWRTRLVQCRRGQWYNPARQICCRGRINNKIGVRVRCCGRSAYDQIFQLCCRGTIQRKFGVYPRCCGRRVYDSHRNRCCRGLIWPKNRRCTF